VSARIKLKSTRRKYRNKPVLVDGIRFASMKEASRWCVLRAMQAAGEIRTLERQRPFPFPVNGLLVCTYVADFTYMRGNCWVVEDVKSPATRVIAVYRIKRNLMKAIYGITILET
jgi:hypothetical protein